MDGEDAMKNVIRKEKKIKSKSKKGEKSDEASMGKLQSQNISDVDATEHARASGKQEIAEMKKAKQIKESKEAGYGIKELTVAYGEDHSGDLMYNVEMKKNKSSHTEKLEENERKSGKSIFKTKKTKDCSKEERKKKHKAKRKLQHVDFEDEEGTLDGKEAEQHFQNSCERKKKKTEKKKSKDDSSLLQQETNVEGNIDLTEHEGNDGKEPKRKRKRDKMKYNNDSGLTHTNEMQIDEVVDYANKTKKKKKKKHTQLIESSSDDFLDDGVECEEKEERINTKPVENGSDEVFPIPCNSNTEEENVGGDGLIRGKRFSPEEDETVKAAVLHYIDKNNLGDDGLEMVLNCKSCPKVRGCWREIGSAIPYRPYSSVYQRVQVLFRRSEARKWTQDEYALLRSYQEKHGNRWTAIAEELGKHWRQVSHAWSRIKLNPKKGNWSQDECQKLFNLVNLDLQAKLSEEKISRHGMLRDNICWTAISEVLSTRSSSRCCVKWYKQLTSRMVRDGVWADKDDYRLIDSLYGLDATCMEDVDWDVLLDNRTGDLCRKRWNQMVLHIGHHRNKSFSEQVEVLAQRYCPILLEARETWDNKPRVG